MSSKSATPDDTENECPGCIIQPQSQSLGEKLPVAGTPFNLHYLSERMPGNIAARTLSISLSGDSVPDSLQGIELITHIFVWDGKDAYGRPEGLRQHAEYRWSDIGQQTHQHHNTE